MPPDTPGADRLPPQNNEAERSVLGSMLRDNAIIGDVVLIVRAEQFYSDAHQKIFAAATELYDKGKPVDYVVLAELLQQRGQIEDIGGYGYLAELWDAAPTAANATYYAGIVRERSLVRNLIHTSTEILRDAYDQVQPADEMVQTAEKKIFEIASSGIVGQVYELREAVNDAFIRIDRASMGEKDQTGVPTGYLDLDEITAGFHNNELVIIAARPSVGKCLTADAEVVLADGSIATIEEVYQRRYAQLLTLHDDYRLRLAEPSAFVDDGIKQVYRVTTRLGRQVDATAIHPFLTLAGWRQLAELRPGDRIAVPRRIDVFGTETLRECEVKLLAYLIGDGCQANASAEIGSSANFSAVTHRDRINTSPAATIELVAPVSAEGIPEVVFRLTRPLMARFLNHLFTNSAEVVNAAGKVRLRYHTASRRLAYQLQHLLLRFGIIASVSESHLTPYGDHGAAWELDINHRQYLYIFLSEIGFSRRWMRRLHAADALGDESLPNLATSDVYWDEIVSITDAGCKQVYDLTIPDTHNFVANDICVHNTAFALNVIRNIVVDEKQPAFFVSLEQARIELAERLLVCQSRVDSHKLRKGRLNSDDIDKLMEAGGILKNAKLFIDDTPAQSMLRIAANARRLKMRQGIKIVVIDYLQLIEPDNRRDPRQEQVAQISRRLKFLARELEIPVVALAQVNRSSEDRQDHRPRLSDLRESGCLTGDTLVTLADTGARMPIRELVGRSGFAVWSLDEMSMKLKPAEVSQAFATGSKPVFRLTTRLGRTIRATANHKFRTLNGWRRLDELQVDECIALPRVVPCAVGATPPTTVSEAPAFLRQVGSSSRTALLSRPRVIQGEEDGSGEPSYSTTLDAALITEDAASDIYWDRIIAITPHGEQEVFDLTVPGPHNFVAADMIVHNSIEQDADTVVLLHRPDRYEPGQHEGIIEVIVGKQRNGPTGEVTLTYVKQYMRFENHAIGTPFEG